MYHNWPTPSQLPGQAGAVRELAAFEISGNLRSEISGNLISETSYNQLLNW
jgi:hypothetical protein